MPDREEWFADTEGNLTGPGDGTAPATDEFGRDDPASLERERRRREREARRSKSRQGGKQPRPAAATAEAPRPASVPEQPTVTKPPPIRHRRRFRHQTARRFRHQTARRFRHQTARRFRRGWGRSVSAEATREVLAAPHPGSRLAPGRGSDRLVSDRPLPATSVRPRRGVGPGDRHDPGGRQRQRRRRVARRRRRGLEQNPVRMAAEARRQERRDPARPLRTRPEHELRSGDRQADQLGRPGDGDHSRGRGQEPDRAPGEGPRADRRLPGGDEELQGFRPEPLRRAQPEVAGGLPLPGDLRGRPRGGQSASSSRSSSRLSSRTSAGSTCPTRSRRT